MGYPSDVRYTREHEWARLENGIVTVGITSYATEQLGDVVFVDLPAVGSGVTAGAAFGTIESVKAVSELFAPVTGEIVAVNERLAQAPEEVNTRPHDTWMVKIHLTGAVPDGLLDSAQYEALLT